MVEKWDEKEWSGSGAKWWRRSEGGVLNARSHGASTLLSGRCSIGCAGRVTRHLERWTGRVAAGRLDGGRSRRILRSSAGSASCARNWSAKAPWVLWAHRRFTMLCAQRVPAPSGPVFGRSTVFSDAMACSTARHGCADRPPRVAGICRAWRSLKGSWIVSMSLKICGWKDAASSKSLRPGRCGDLPSGLGRPWWPQPTSFSAPWNYFGANMDCLPSPSLITTSVSKAGTTIPMSSGE